MQKVKIVISLFIVTFLVFACTTKGVKKPSFDYCGREVTLSKDIIQGTLGKPVQLTNTFSSEDSEVIACLTCRNLTGEHGLRWEWYDPDGDLYLTTGNYPLSTASGKYRREVTAWHKLSIKGEKAANLTGDWLVKVFFDGVPLASKSFKIEERYDLMKIIKNMQPVAEDKNKYAFIIGIEKYGDTVPAALYAKRDALLMKEYFKRLYGVPVGNIFTLINEEATLARIKDYIVGKDKLRPRLAPKDTLYVYYSGHGGAEGSKEQPPVAYLIAQDSNPN
ncbi:MAG TPA: caspase family protein, partial [Desulfatiglandales bacterium]|nr:caspase family protein [Desulfatiglandales bacterium]